MVGRFARTGNRLHRFRRIISIYRSLRGDVIRRDFRCRRAWAAGLADVVRRLAARAHGRFRPETMDHRAR